jgi:hypothetical protein
MYYGQLRECPLNPPEASRVLYIDPMNKPLNLSPQLGERWVTVRRQTNGLWEVHVRVFKANTLRGDSYWNTEVLRTFGKKADAERYASRFGWGGQSA